MLERDGRLIVTVPETVEASAAEPAAALAAKEPATPARAAPLF